MAHEGQSGLGPQVKVNEIFSVVLSTLGSGLDSKPQASCQDLSQSGEKKRVGIIEVADAGATLHLKPYTLHPTLYTIHPTCYNPHPTPYTLRPTTYTLHPITLNPKP